MIIDIGMFHHYKNHLEPFKKINLINYISKLLTLPKIPKKVLLLLNVKHYKSIDVDDVKDL